MEQGTRTPPGPAGDHQDGSGAQEMAGKVAGQAQEKAQQASAQARDRVRKQVDERSAQAGEQLASTASDVRSVAEALSKQGKEQPAKLATQVAERTERIGGYLKESDADRLLADLEDFGREKPWALALGGVVAGLAASRFLKASSSERYRSSQIIRSSKDGADRARGVRTVSGPPPATSSPAAKKGL